MPAIVPTASIAALLGGVTIGVAVAVLLLLSGRVAGISGIVGGLVVSQPGERTWRAAFVAGLLAGGLVARAVAPEMLGEIGAPLPVLGVAGLLVGFGTRLGGGCTSGHGVCGVSRGSPRSIVATLVFMLVAGAVVFLLRRGGAS